MVIGDRRRGGRQSRGITAGVSDRLTVRPARPDEIEEVGRLALEAYLADGMVNPAGPYAVELADASRRASDAELLVAVDTEGMLLGTITVCTPGSPLGELSRPGELEFRMLAVAPGARRRGVGEALVRNVLARATETGAHRVVLCSAAEMRVAHRLYARLGFIRMPERDWYPLPGVRLLAFGATTAASGPR
jgi:ribosomal protein S18 acetylase RimI-like enzyme